MTRGFLPNAPQQSEQQEKKSLRNQSAENGTEPFGPVTLYSVLVAETAYNLPCTSSAVCTWQGRVPISGRSPQTTMDETDTTEQTYGGGEPASGIVKNQRMEQVARATDRVGVPKKPQHGKRKIETGTPGTPQTTMFSFEGQEARGEKTVHYKEILRFGVFQVFHPRKNPSTSGVYFGTPHTPVARATCSTTSEVTL